MNMKPGSFLPSTLTETWKEVTSNQGAEDPVVLAAKPSNDVDKMPSIKIGGLLFTVPLLTP